MKTYLDSGSLEDIKNYAKKRNISGFTTNPSLLRKSKINNYKEFVFKCKKIVGIKSISFEVTADDRSKILKQAKWLKENAKNCYIKVPVVNSKGRSNIRIIKELQAKGCKLNITAVFTEKQVVNIFKNIDTKKNCIISIFAGRIADTGKSPVKIINLALKKSQKKK